MHDPEKWTLDSLRLESKQSIQEIYMNTYFARGRFGRGVLLAPQNESNEIVIAEEIYSRNIFTLEKLFESLKSINDRKQNVVTLCPVNNTSIQCVLTFLFSLIAPYRCVTFKSQLPSRGLMDKLLLVTEMLPTLIKDLMQKNENDCGLVEILVFELLYCILLHLNIIKNQTNTSKVIGFTWKLFKLVANVTEATTLVVLRFDKLQTNHFKREFILGIVKAMKRALQRASDLIERESPNEHCTETFPEETMEQIRHCVLRLDVDDWYTRIHNWTVDVEINLHFTTEFPQFPRQSLREFPFQSPLIARYPVSIPVKH